MGLSRWWLVCWLVVILPQGTRSMALPTINIGLFLRNGSKVYDDISDYLSTLLESMPNFDNGSVTLHQLETPLLDDPFHATRQACSELSESPIHGLLAHVDCPDTRVISGFAAHAQLPMLSLTSKACLDDLELTPPDMETTEYPVTTSGEDVVHIVQGRRDPVDAIVEVIEKLGSSQVIVFYNAAEAMAEVDDLMTSLAEIAVAASLYDLAEGSDVTTLVAMSKRLPEYAFPYILVTRDETTRQILAQASDLDLRRRQYKWLVYGTERQTLVSALLSADNIALLEPTQEEELVEEERVHLQEATSSLVTAFAAIVGHGRWEPKPPSDVSGTGCQDLLPHAIQRGIVEEAQDLLPAESVYNGTWTEYRLLSSLAVLDNPPHLEQVAEWTSDGALSVTDPGLYPNAFNGYNQRRFTVSSVPYSFFQRKEVQADGSVKWVGLTFTLLDELATDLNFTYEVVEPEDGYWGVGDENGTWNGMIRDVMDGKVDFAAACFSITGPRESVTDMAEPYFHELSAIIIQRPDGANKILLYIQPFSWTVWGCCVGCVTLCGFLYCLFNHACPLYDNEPTVTDTVHGMRRIANSTLYVFGSFVQQGGVWLPRSQSGRIFVGFFWVFAIVMAATYTGNLIAFLAVASIHMPFNTLSEMVQQDDIEWGLASGVAMEQLFREATFEPYTDVHRGMVNVQTYGEGLSRVKTGEYAFVAEKSWYEMELSNDCNLAMIKETFYPTNYGWSFPTNSPHLQIINDRIKMLNEAGILAQWTKQWTPKSLNCTGLKPVTNAKVVTVNDFQGALIIIGIGSGLGTITLIIECFTKCCCTKDPPGDGVTGDSDPQTNGSKQTPKAREHLYGKASGTVVGDTAAVEIPDNSYGVR